MYVYIYIVMHVYVHNTMGNCIHLTELLYAHCSHFIHGLASQNTYLDPPMDQLVCINYINITRQFRCINLSCMHHIEIY